jgi:hypothetical protein
MAASLSCNNIPDPSSPTSNPTSRFQVSLRDPSSWNFDIDRWLNRCIPPPPWKHLPYCISRFCGYRETPPKDLGNILITFWAFIGVFCGISIVEVVSLHIPSFGDHGAPIISPCFVSDSHLQLDAYLPERRIRFFLVLPLPVVLLFILVLL